MTLALKNHPGLPAWENSVCASAGGGQWALGQGDKAGEEAGGLEGRVSASCCWMSPELQHSLWMMGVGRTRKGVGTRHIHAKVPPDRPFCRSFVFWRWTPFRKSWTIPKAQRGVATVLHV